MPEQTQDVESIRCDIARKVPAMRRGCRIQTSYGDIEIDADEAEDLADIVRWILTRRISRAKKRNPNPVRGEK